jgi:hypothetical protein
MTRGDLIARAARCDRLAEVCRDPLVAQKLRQLSRDYWELARKPASPPLPSPRSQAKAVVRPPSDRN